MDQSAIDQQLSGLGDSLRRALYRQLVCGANLAMVQGLADHLDGAPPSGRYRTPSPDAAASC